MTEEGDYPQSTCWNPVSIKRNYYLAVRQGDFFTSRKIFSSGTLSALLARAIHWIRGFE